MDQAFGVYLLVSALIVWLAHRIAGRFGRPGRYALLGIAAIVPALALDELRIADYLRSLVGDPSMSLIVLIAIWLGEFAAQRALFGARQWLVLAAVVLPAGLVLYTSALGAVYFDIYSLGYAPLPFLLVLGVIALAAWTAHYPLLAVCVLAAAAGCALGLLESRNLWDYLIDPLLVAWALGRLLARAPGYARWLNRPAVPS